MGISFVSFAINVRVIITKNKFGGCAGHIKDLVTILFISLKVATSPTQWYTIRRWHSLNIRYKQKNKDIDWYTGYSFWKFPFENLNFLITHLGKIRKKFSKIPIPYKVKNVEKLENISEKKKLFENAEIDLHHQCSIRLILHLIN